MALTPVLGALTNGRRNGREARGMGGVIGVQTTVDSHVQSCAFLSSSAHHAAYGSRYPLPEGKKESARWLVVR